VVRRPPSRFEKFVTNFTWKDLVLVAVVCLINTVWAAYLPMLNGKPQPALMSHLFDKTLVATSDEWVVGPFGVFGTMLLCFVMKWCTTIMALSLPTPTGVVAPAMIIGALIGRCFVLLIPEFVQDFLLAGPNGEAPTEDIKGAFMARCAILGAAAFCAAVCRAFAMAITVFEVLTLPNTVLPLCSATLAAIFVANKIELPFFDRNLAGRGLYGISALSFGTLGDEPAFSIMDKVNTVNDCLQYKTRLFDMHELLKRHPEEHTFPIVRMIDENHGSDAILVGTMPRECIEQVIRMMDPKGVTPEMMVDLMVPWLQHPPDNGVPLVHGCPPTVSPSQTAKDVYLMMKVAHGDNLVYVVREGCILGKVTFEKIMRGDIRHSAI